MMLFICLTSSFLVSLNLMPLSVRLASRVGAMSDTGGRHVGSSPIGRLGGTAVCLGIICSLSIAGCYQKWFGGSFSIDIILICGVISGWLIIGLVGLCDDLIRIRAVVKLLVQVVASIVVYYSGVRLTTVEFPIFGVISLGVFGLPLTVGWIVGIVNAVNLIDGLDGLAGGVVLSAAAVNLVAALVFKSYFSAVLMVSVVGAVGAFLLYNWHPAKIYLGDAGAYSLGYLLAVSALMSPIQKVSTGVSLVVPILAVGLPIVEMILTIMRRIINKSGVFSPDRFHLHHLLLDSGMGYKRVVFGLYMFSWVFCSVALVLVLQRQRLVGYILLFFSTVGTLFWSLSVRMYLLRIINDYFKKKLRDKD